MSTRRHLLLDITLAGRVYRLSDDTFDVTESSSGKTYSYEAGFDSLTVGQALAFLGEANGLSVPIEAVMPVDVALLDARGYGLSRCPATLSVWTEDTDYVARKTLLGGVVVDPEWGEEGQPVTFSVEDAVMSSPAQIPEATARVDDLTWTLGAGVQRNEENEGVPYPIIFGTPGRLSATEWITGSQGVWGNEINLFWQLVIAGHAVSAPYVRLNTDLEPDGLIFAVAHKVDDLGRTVAFVDAYTDYPTQSVQSVVVGAYTVYGLRHGLAVNFQSTIASGNIPVFVGWLDEPTGTTDGGLSPLAGDIIQYLLAFVGADIDYGRVAAANTLLAAYRLDCSIEVPSLPLAWLQERVFPIVPVSITRGPNGWYPVVWRYDAVEEDATAKLNCDVDPDIQRVGGVKEESGTVANKFTLNYRYSIRAGTFTESLHRGDDDTPDSYCTASQALYGVIEKSIDTRVVYDESTGHAILRWMARAYCFPRKRLRYLVPVSYGLTLGQTILLTDTPLYFSSRLAMVVDVQVDGTDLDGVELLLISDPARDPRHV